RPYPGTYWAVASSEERTALPRFPRRPRSHRGRRPWAGVFLWVCRPWDPRPALCGRRAALPWSCSRCLRLNCLRLLPFCLTGGFCHFLAARSIGQCLSGKCSSRRVRSPLSPRLLCANGKDGKTAQLGPISTTKHTKNTKKETYGDHPNSD